MNRFRKTRKSISIITGVITGVAVFAVTITAITDGDPLKTDNIESCPSVVSEFCTGEGETTDISTSPPKRHTEKVKDKVTKKISAEITDVTSQQTTQPAVTSETSADSDQFIDHNEQEPDQGPQQQAEEYNEEQPQPEPEVEQLCCEEVPAESPEQQPVQETTLSLLGTFESTAYTWTGSTCASGNYPYTCKNIDGNNYRSVAVDTSIIPLGTRLYIEAGDYSGYAVAEDTGGCIYGYIIDVYMDSYSECINWGRRNIVVYTVN